MLNLIDEHSRECLMIRSERRWSSAKVIEALADVMVMKGVPEHLRSDNGPEFVAKGLRKWLAGTGAKTAYIKPGRISFVEEKISRFRNSSHSFELKLSQSRSPMGRVLAERWPSSLQHHPATLLTGLQTTGLGGKELGVWRSGNRYALPTSPHPRLRLSIDKNSRATLTKKLVQKIGQTRLQHELLLHSKVKYDPNRILTPGPQMFD